MPRRRFGGFLYLDPTEVAIVTIYRCEPQHEFSQPIEEVLYAGIHMKDGTEVAAHADSARLLIDYMAGHGL